MFDVSSLASTRDWTYLGNCSSDIFVVACNSLKFRLSDFSKRSNNAIWKKIYKLIVNSVRFIKLKHFVLKYISQFSSYTYLERCHVYDVCFWKVSKLDIPTTQMVKPGEFATRKLFAIECFILKNYLCEFFEYYIVVIYKAWINQTVWK